MSDPWYHAMNIEDLEDKFMGETEGAVCDECGNKVGPMGCCATARNLGKELGNYAEEVECLRKELTEAWILRDEMAELLKEARQWFPSEEDILNYAATNEDGRGCLGGVIVRRIESVLWRVEESRRLTTKRAK